MCAKIFYQNKVGTYVSTLIKYFSTVASCKCRDDKLSKDLSILLSRFCICITFLQQSLRHAQVILEFDVQVYASAVSKIIVTNILQF